MKNSIEVGHLLILSREKNFKSGYIASLNQKQKFVITIVLIVLGNDGAKQQCRQVSMSYVIIFYKKIIWKKFTCYKN